MTHTGQRSFKTIGAQGLRHDILPMRLYHKAKKLGVWDPRSIDLSQDIVDWQRCSEGEKQTILILTALFQAGEESVLLDLLPLISVIAQEGHIEEEMFLSSFLWEEAKHTEFFRRFLDEVAHEKKDLHEYHSPSYHKIFYEELPQTMQALRTDPSPTAQVKASVTYNMIVEGVLAETGYKAYFDMLERNQFMPGLKQGITYLRQDEARHIAYGIFLISRLMAQDESLWNIAEQRMNELLPFALGVIMETDDSLPKKEEERFHVKLADYANIAMLQFNKRVMHIERARKQSLEQLYQEIDSDTIIE